jgi:hypothetical protein
MSIYWYSISKVMSFQRESLTVSHGIHHRLWTISTDKIAHHDEYENNHVLAHTLELSITALFAIFNILIKIS